MDEQYEKERPVVETTPWLCWLDFAKNVVGTARWWYAKMREKTAEGTVRDVTGVRAPYPD